ncbi:hypothetical protein BU16DRAFT_542200 [Lophium mytilinum]|uniref:Uncharacterized protein n=1 Tax=Lophium mytilinum TaxID=390894 RepID=A0A6A6QJV2_9PEZI|nr:hypothetical protein BU16DRAFT_542200 [Lophium mytilinum]
MDIHSLPNQSNTTLPRPSPKATYCDATTQTDFPKECLAIRLPTPTANAAPFEAFLDQHVEQLPDHTRALKACRQKALQPCVRVGTALYDRIRQEIHTFSEHDQWKVMEQTQKCIMLSHQDVDTKAWAKLRRLCKGKWNGDLVVMAKEYDLLRRRYRGVLAEIEADEIVVVFKTERFREQVEMLRNRAADWYDFPLE